VPDVDDLDAADLKIIPDDLVTGSSGETLVAARAQAMGFLFHPPGRLEGGLDGIIELRDPKTKGLTSDLIGVQSKATDNGFKNDDGRTFTFNVDAKDLNYWLKLPMPVILVLSRPATNEAYYVVIEEYFADAETRAKRRVTFDKTRDRFPDNPEVMLEIARRDANRRALAPAALLEGPMTILGLSVELEKSEEATTAARAKSTPARWRKAATLWGELADAIAATGVPRRLVWPALEQRHVALREAGDREEAARARLELAKDKIRLDEPSAWFDLAGLEWLINLDKLGFDLQLASAYANWSEHGAEALDALRALVKDATTPTEKRATGALLVEVLSIYGEYEEAHAVAGKLRKTKVALGPRLALELDWLDAAAELGHDVEQQWQALLTDKNLNRISEARARVLQRRGCFLARRGKSDEAQASFRQAAAVWRGVFGADDQVMEALNSALAAAAFCGTRRMALPFGAGAAAALARGSAQVPAVRAELLTLRGLNYLLDEHYPDALRHLTAALAIHYREGNLAAARNTRLFLARAFIAVDEPATALAYFVRAGADKQGAAVAKELTFREAEAALRLKNAPPFELAPSFAAAAAVKGGLRDEEAARVADDVLAAATPRPRIYTPDPHGPARRLLAQIAPSLDAARAKKAAKILREEVKAGGPLQAEATRGLIVMSQNGLADSGKFFLERLLDGQDLPITIAGYLRKAKKQTQQRVVDAALQGNVEALVESARADLPPKWPALRAPIAERVEAAVAEPDDSEPIEDITYMQTDMRGFGELARHVEPELRRRFIEHLISVVLATEHDELEKLAAIDAAFEVAPALDEQEARRLWKLLVPISAGHFPESAPAVIASHDNPKRARNIIRRNVTPQSLRAHALRAIKRLVSHLANTQDELERTTASALASDDAELVHVALWVARDLGVTVDTTRLEELARHEDLRVATLAAELADRLTTAATHDAGGAIARVRGHEERG
jgi:Domain of unknown function (DUF4365)